MEHIYPAGPATVPENLTKPTSAYKRHAWLAMAGLGSFMAAYFALAGWFTLTAYRLLSGVLNGGGEAGVAIIAGLSAGLLAVFMLKALFFVKHRYEIKDIEITAAQHPRLFEFLHRLADEAKAPRPHRVFLSSQVNAAVFYDLSLINLIFPSRKNLEIGLGLVNVLTLGELKAVLAHEFGHFAQRSMAVGRWVYIAQQIAGEIIAKRDALDSFLQKLSRLDLRIAWIGWLLSLTIWSIRSLMETLFRLVVLTQRALSREMEFQADLVAVSLTGSDALIHALHRLQVADEAWERALNFAGAEAHEGRKVRDVFAVQNRVIQHFRAILGKPDYGQVPPVPRQQPESHRLFQPQLAQAPQMWSTHPPNSERENNAKRTYVAAPIDERSAWELFDDAQSLKEQMSAHLIPVEKAEAVPLEESLTKLDGQYSRTFLNREYRGAYLGRSLVRHAKLAADLYDSKLDPQAVIPALDALYPDSLAQDLERLRNLEDEQAALEALREGVMDAPGGVIRHRGRELKRHDLPRAIEELRAEIAITIQHVESHDRRCRTAHLSAAAVLGAGWEAYLAGLAAVQHYADHTEANLRDAQRHVSNVLAVVTADGRVSDGELQRLVTAAIELHQPLSLLYRQSDSVFLGRTLAQKLGVETWKEGLGEFGLRPPHKDNINEWLNGIDAWVNAGAGALSALRFGALEELLVAEADVARFIRDGSTPGEAPAASQVPSSYPVLISGSERVLQTKLGLWDRIQIADGLFPTIARLAVAVSIVGAVLMVGGSVGESEITIYNGLARPVRVEVAGRSAALAPFSRAQLEIAGADSYTVRTRTMEGQEVESFAEKAAGSFGHYVYNVAGAGPIVEWTVAYGNAAARPEQRLGAPRWMTTSANFLFEEPPDTVRIEGGGATRVVLSGFGDASPSDAVGLLSQGADPKPLIAAHARWDDLSSRHILKWFALAESNGVFTGILDRRLMESPASPLLLRIEQDSARTDKERETVCLRHTSMARAAASNPDMQYISDRCIPEPDQRDQAFIAHYRASPDNGWLALAAGYTFAEQGRWPDAVRPLGIARSKLAPMADSAAADLARVRRMSEGLRADLEDLQKDSESLRALQALESGQEVTGSYLAYRALAEGRLDEAVKLGQGTPEVEARVIRFAAASDGASRNMIQKALKLAVDERLDEGVAWTMLGLAAREGIDITPYVAAVSKSAMFTPDTLRRLVEAARSDPAAFDKMLENTHPVIRGRAYVLGVIVRGNDSPSTWREAAKRLLFSSERPYFM